MSRTLVVLAMLAAGCGSWLPAPPRTGHEGREPVLVPVAPPTPRVEIIPERPLGTPDIVWIDGEWLWRRGRWEWRAGRWEVPPPGQKYALPQIVYLANDRIGWFSGGWREVASNDDD